MQLSLTEAADTLSRVLPAVSAEGLEALDGANLRCWDEVIIERWLPAGNPRWDIMGAVSRVDALARGPARWRQLALARMWVESRVPASLLWFEWDLDRLDSASPDPLCSVCVSDNVIASAAERRVPTDRGELAQLRATALAAVSRPADGPTLEALVSELGEGGELLHIADLSPRGRATRLAFFVRAERVIPWLRRCGWSGPLDRLPAILFSACAPWEQTAIQVEIDGASQLSSYVGVESREWVTAIPRVQVELWGDSFAELGIECDRERLHRWAQWAGTHHEVGEHRTRCVGFVFFKTAFDGERWVCKGYIGVRPEG